VDLQSNPPLLEYFRWMEANLPGGTFLRESTYGFTVLLTVHVVAMCLFLGLIIMMDLRLVGAGNRRTPPAEIQKRLFPWQMVGFAVIVVSGVLLFYSKPLYYYGKGFFWTKMALMALAGVNAGVIHLVTYRSEAGWDRPLARLAGAISLLLWGAVLVTGRLIAYEWWTTEYFLEDF
jgi:hypothetical protein